MKLSWNLFVKGMRPHGQLAKKLRQKITKLETHLQHFPEDAVHLRVNLQRDPKKEMFRAGLTLDLPARTLYAEKTGGDPVPAFDQAIKVLLREIAVLKSALRHERQWQRNPELVSTGAGV